MASFRCTHTLLDGDRLISARMSSTSRFHNDTTMPHFSLLQYVSCKGRVVPLLPRQSSIANHP